MSMTPSRLGQQNQTGDLEALFYAFIGEVLTAFDESNITMDKVFVQTVKKGSKGVDFPLVGKIAAAYHTPGAQLTGKNVNHAKQFIGLDGVLIADAFIDNLDEMMSSYEIRSKYSHQMGQTLANAADLNNFLEIIKAARAATIIADGTGGTEIESDMFKIDGSGSSDVQELAENLASGLFQAAQTFDEKNIPEGLPRYACFRPSEYYALAQNTTLINKLWGGTGALSEGNILKVAGFQILKSNHVPKNNAAKATYDPANGTAYVANPYYSVKHAADCTKTVGVAWCPDAIGVVKMQDLSFEQDYLIDYQGTLMLAKYAMGHGILRQEQAIEFKLKTLNNGTYSYPA